MDSKVINEVLEGKSARDILLNEEADFEAWWNENQDSPVLADMYDEYVYELEQMGQKEDALGIKEWAKQEVFPEGYMESKINEELDRESQEGLDNFLRVTGWEIKDEKEFPSEIEAENWAKENGYSIGSMQRGAPRAMAQGDMYIAKWRNIGDEDYERIEALLLVSGEQGDRSAKIVFFDTVLE